MRSKGISVQIILQAKSQLDKLYKQDSKIILQNCDTTVFLGTNDKDTAKEMAETLGDMTIQIQSTSRQVNSPLITGHTNESEQYQGKKLMSAEDLYRKSRKQNIIVQNGSYPFIAIKTPFYEHPLAKGYKKRDPNSIIPPPHKGFELFSREDYDRIAGFTLQPSMDNAEDVEENFISQHDFNILDILDGENEKMVADSSKDQEAQVEQEDPVEHELQVESLEESIPETMDSISEEDEQVSEKQSEKKEIKSILDII
jgi:hypothetical protein